MFKCIMIRKILIIVLIWFLNISCSYSENEQHREIMGLQINGWGIQAKRGKTDTLKLESWMPQAEISLTFKNLSDTTCLSPILEFYPIEMEKYMETTLTNYLILRSAWYREDTRIFTSVYTTEEFYVIAWNLEENGDHICDDCKKLKMNLKVGLGLELKEDQVLDFIKNENK